MTIKEPERDQGALRLNTSVVGQDPSALTTQQLLRENFWLRELLESRIEGIEERINSGNKAVELLQAFADRTPTTMDVKNDVMALREVVMEMFKGVTNQFLQNDKALTAALQAQEKQAIATNDNNKTSIAKSESQTADSIKSLGILFDTSNKATNAKVEDSIKAISSKVDDIKSRLDKGEGGSSATTDVRKDNRDNVGLIVGIIAAAIALGALFIKH